MTKSNRKASDETTSTADPETPKTEKKERFHVISGVPHRVIRSFYDSRQNCVIDVIEMKKIVQNRRGEDKEITVTRETYCRDEAIQAKYRKDLNAKTEVQIDV